MSVDAETLAQAKRQAVLKFMSLPGVTGIGIGDGVIRVYVLNADVKSRLPEEIDGVPIEIVVTGDIEAQSF